MASSLTVAAIFALVVALFPALVLTAGGPALAGSIFGDGFEVGSVCYWSDSAPTFPCGLYQTCADADGDVWACFELPFSAPPVPLVEDGEWLPPAVDAADVYVLFDRSGDMSAERTSLRDNLGAVRQAVACPPIGNGAPGACYPDLWMGAGLINYAGQAPAFQNFLDLQPAPNFASVPISEAGGCCEEGWLLSAWAAVTGQGSATSGCVLPGYVCSPEQLRLDLRRRPPASLLSAIPAFAAQRFRSSSCPGPRIPPVR